MLCNRIESSPKIVRIRNTIILNRIHKLFRNQKRIIKSLHKKALFLLTFREESIEILQNGCELHIIVRV